MTEFLDLVPFVGTLLGRPVEIDTVQGETSKVAVLILPWSKYPTGAVQINLNSQGTTLPLDRIVYTIVDNRQSKEDIFIQVPDTLDTILVPRGRMEFVPILSQMNIINVYNFSFISPLFTTKSITQITISNFDLKPFMQTGLVPVVGLRQRTAFDNGVILPTPLYATDVVGDVHFDIVRNANVDGTFNLQQPATVVAGFLIITNLEISLFGVYKTSGSKIASISISDAFGNLAFGPLQFVLSTNMDFYSHKVIYRMSKEYMVFLTQTFINPPKVTISFAASGGRYKISYDCMFTNHQNIVIIVPL